MPGGRLSGVDQSMVSRGCHKLGLRTLLTSKSVNKGPKDLTVEGFRRHRVHRHIPLAVRTVMAREAPENVAVHS